MLGDKLFFLMHLIFEAWSGLIWLYLQVFLFDEQQLRLRRLYISTHREHGVQEISLWWTNTVNPNISPDWYKKSIQMSLFTIAKVPFHMFVVTFT